ncbi:MAG: TatD family hydrolase [Pyrinomonadaceae bacterium]
MYIDSHCHIDGERFQDDIEDVVNRALESGVEAMLNVGTGSPKDRSFEETVGLTERFPSIYGAVGIHPHDASEYDESVERRLLDLTRNEKIIAWGEIGLDYHYDHSPRDIQKKVFERQLNVAAETSLPVIIHSRSADDDTIEILRRALGSGNTRGGIMHCFGGSVEMAQQALDLGMMISFAGNITFKKADELRAAAKVVPLERLLIETDSPYLTPEPHRGKRNEPARVADTCRFLADFLELDEHTLAKTTTSNFYRFFGLQSAKVSE